MKEDKEAKKTAIKDQKLDKKGEAKKEEKKDQKTEQKVKGKSVSLATRGAPEEVQAVLLDDDVETKEADKDEKEKEEEENFSKKEVGFDDMMRYGFAQREAFGSIKCTTDEFGDPAPGQAKQCFCEAETPAEPVERCALESEKTDCVCLGKVYYGQLEVGDESPASFESMKADKKFVVIDSKGSLGCNNEDIGSDPVPGKAKQCFCEKGAKPEVKRCGYDDDDCTCKGNIFYGILELDKKKPVAFKDMLGEDFQYKESNGKTPVKCAASSFGKDPQPGKAKQCYCDGIEEMSKEEIKNALDLLDAKEEAKKAEEEAKLLEEEKKKKEAEEAAKIKELEEKRRQVEA